MIGTGTPSMSLTKNIPLLNTVRSFRNQMDILSAPTVFVGRASWATRIGSFGGQKEAEKAPRKIGTTEKGLYKKFWTMLCHRGLWQDERYLARKSLAVRLDSRHRRFVWQSHAYKREIMQDCVVRQVRDWFPNLPSQPYMGHLWQWYWKKFLKTWDTHIYAVKKTCLVLRDKHFPGVVLFISLTELS